MFKRTPPSVASQSFERSYTELMTLSPQAALNHFHVRHDQLIEQVSTDSGQSRACARGCSYCCHFKVIADAVEIFAMVDYVKTHLNASQQQLILQLAKANVEEAKPLSHEQQLTINQTCPLLVDQVCVVYPVRSIKCRNFHAVDDSSCRASYNRPDDLTILNDSIPALYIAATGSGDGFMRALHSHGYDHRLYDLNSAFIEAFEQPECQRRYAAKKRAFSTTKFEI